MFVKLFHFLALFGYLNILVYEANHQSIHTNQAFFNGDTLIEFVLDDLLNIPLKEHAQDIDVPFDEYRIFSSGAYILPILFFLTAFLFSVRFYTYIRTYHPYYGNKSNCLPGYYSFLFRYKPF